MNEDRKGNITTSTIAAVLEEAIFLIQTHPHPTSVATTISQ